MPVELIPAAHQLVLHETAPDLAVGDAVAVTLALWDEGEKEVTGEVIALPAPGRIKLRVVYADGQRGAVNVPAEACRLVLAAALRRAA